MNVPRSNEAGFFDLGAVDVTGSELAAHLVTDLMVAGSYLLLLFIIVYLNRTKYVSIYVPKRTYLVAFGIVFALTFGASITSILAPGTAVYLGYKVFISAILVAIVLAVWRILPRDIDPYEQQRLRLQNVAMEDAQELQRQAEAKLHDAVTEIDAKVEERTRDLSSTNLELEKEVIERRLAEERATEAKRRLDELIMRTNTALVYIDSDSTVLDCNLGLAQLLGRGSIDEMVGRKLGRLLGLKDETELAHFMNEALRKGTFETEIDAAPPARGVVSVEANGAASILNGRPCVMALLWDVTQRAASERELLQSREALTAALDVARKANATRSDFLAKMNHELRTPLNGIIGLSEIIRHKAANKHFSGSEAQKLVANIHQSGRHLLSVVDDLLDLSRLDAGTRELSPTQISVRAEIDAAVITLASIADKKRIAIDNRCDAALEWTVDQRAFKQIIINLVNNAVKFSPPGSKVAIEVTHTAEAMLLHIRDQGPGVASGDRSRILEPFGRGEYAQSHKVDGVGLGLTIVSELLKLQGGKIEIESDPGSGATFTATFPAGAPRDHAKPSTTA